MKKNIIVFAIFVIVAIFLNACLIEEVEQPAEIGEGEVFTTAITVTDMNAESGTPHKGALCIMVPNDWDFISGEYESTVQGGITGEIVLDPNPDTPVYGNVDTLIVPPEGMKWIKCLSDTGYLHDANVTHVATVGLQVGETSGTFPIGYLVTVNTIDMFKFVNDDDEDDTMAGVDTCMNNWVTVIDVSTDDDSPVLHQFSLSQNYPNPFNPVTKIEFSISEKNMVNLSVFDLAGNEVATLVSEVRNPGNYSVTFSGKGLASGIYFYRLTAGDKAITKKMLLMK
jgi:hypothetical protein